MIERVVTGGQTGVDRAALDAALEAGVSVGGWCPRGRRAEDGPLPPRYPLTETPSAEYPQRTVWNVRDSDGTLILSLGPLEGGTALTEREAERRGRPCLVVDLRRPVAETRAEVEAWLERTGVRVLNVAGPRASEVPGIYAAARSLLGALLATAARR